MPLTPEQKAAYGPDWEAVSREIRDRSSGRCECAGECGWDPHVSVFHLVGIVEGCEYRCTARHGWPSPYTGSMVVLTTAHLDHNPGVNDRDRLKAMCQGCHLRYDANHRRSRELSP